ncbi:MAG: ribose-5-phosphate isomerase RpiA [Polyangiaceae bacterium]
MSDEAKRMAADAALLELPQGGTLGLGTGSTAKLFIDGVGRLVAEGRTFVAIPTSKASRTQASNLGIALLEDDGPWDVDVTVDGADEVDANLNLIKGGGAAHAREKIVNFASKRNVIIVDGSKMSTKLGEKWPIPLEVSTFGHGATAARLAAFGTPVLRVKDGVPVRTDAGNYVYDLKVPPMDDPGAMDRTLRAVPGVVETGLFVGRADVVLVAETEGGQARVRKLERKR